MQSDNTVKELRNQYQARMQCCLVQQYIFQSCTEGHLGVGHTHEDVDGCLSLAKAALDATPVLETPADVKRCLEQRLKHVFSKRNQMFEVDVVSSVP